MSRFSRSGWMSGNRFELKQCKYLFKTRCVPNAVSHHECESHLKSIY
jgi:hypothetical protein